MSYSSDPRTWELAAPTIDPTSSWLLPRSTAIGWLSEEDTMSSWHLWWGPPAPTFWDHWATEAIFAGVLAQRARVRFFTSLTCPNSSNFCTNFTIAGQEGASRRTVVQNRKKLAESQKMKVKIFGKVQWNYSHGAVLKSSAK